MDEILKCYQVLGLKGGCSEAELEEAYRERAEAWSPDNFSGNPQLRSKAQEKLKDVNAAYEILRARLSPATIAPTAKPTAPAPGGKRVSVLVSVVILGLLLLGVALLLIWGTEH
ncbi:MAG: DnaJ-class molecular chaperone with C-terminal Zn finger domain [Pedosphaera sp.]|nr:DnaJ-class molecular chaperone with C-terminal Zn finger domain [Pedosphaera sp.]